MGSLVTVNCTIASNVTGAAGDGGGLDVYSGAVTLKNTIVASNTAGTGASAPADDISLNSPSGPTGSVASGSQMISSALEVRRID